MITSDVKNWYQIFDLFKYEYISKIGSDSVVGLESCDDFKDYVFEKIVEYSKKQKKRANVELTDND